MPERFIPAVDASRRRRWQQEIRARLSSLGLAPDREAEIVDELSQHLEDEYRECLAGGASPDEAAQTALAEFRAGNVLARHMAVLRQSHVEPAVLPETSAGRLLANVWQDVRYALRLLRRQPGFAAAAVMSLALGVGVNTTMFTVIYNVLLRGLPYPDPDRLVRVVQAHSGGDVLIREFEFVKDNAHAFAAIAAYRGGGEQRIGPAENQNWISTIVVSQNFLQTLGLRPQIGREFDADETRPGAPPAVILSDGVWRNLFGADPAIAGRTVLLNDTNATVIGVLPAGFWFPQRVDAILPLRVTGNLADTGANTQIIARIGDGADMPRAQAEVAAMAERLRDDHAAHGTLLRNYRGLAVLGYRDWLVGDVRLNLLLLFGATGMLVLIACGNLALLLLTRAAARAREIAVRMALGSSRTRLLGQMLTENLLLTGLGATAGVIAAYALVRVFVSVIPFTLPAAAPIRVNSIVLAFTVVTALSTALLVTVVPFLGSRRLNVAVALRSEGKNTAGAVRARARNTFIVGEVMLATTLLVAAALLIQTLYRTTRQDLGFVPDRVLTFETPLSPERARNAAERGTFTRRLLEQLQHTPGVTAAAATNLLPLGAWSNLPTQRDGHPEQSIGGMEVRAVTADYFAVMGMPVRRGRSIRAAEIDGAAPIAMVNETVARTWWPDGAALGDRLTIGRFRGKTLLNDVSREVIGVVGDTRGSSLQRVPPPTVFVPMGAAFGSSSMAWVLKTDGSPSLADLVRAAVATVDPRQRILRLRTMDDIVASASARPRFNASLFGMFAAVALVLTVVGLYGVLSFLVTQRRQEIGTRMALGASRAAVLRGVVRHGLSLTAVGLALGLLTASVVTRWLSTMLFGVVPHDAASFTAVAALVLGVGGAASYVPARRAATIDPIVAMRSE
jgi:predicted permease